MSMYIITLSIFLGAWWYRGLLNLTAKPEEAPPCPVCEQRLKEKRGYRDQ